MILGRYDVDSLCSEPSVRAIREDTGEYLQTVDKHSPSARAADERRWKPRLACSILSLRPT